MPFPIGHRPGYPVSRSYQGGGTNWNIATPIDSPTNEPANANWDNNSSHGTAVHLGSSQGDNYNNQGWFIDGNSLPLGMIDTSTPAPHQGQYFDDSVDADGEEAFTTHAGVDPWSTNNVEAEFPLNMAPPNADIGPMVDEASRLQLGQGREAGGRMYNPDRRRVELEAGRARMECGIDGCTLMYATKNSRRRHWKNKHRSEARFCGRCLYLDCEAKRWGNTEEGVWSNIQTHQREAVKKGNHSVEILDGTKEERCKISRR
ncbi:hypothetical protein TWF281_004781 [Arthrobotrys megalospora]